MSAPPRKTAPTRDLAPPRPAVDAWLEGRRRTVLAILCVLAAVRLTVFICGVPFFNNVDEMNHFDAVVECSHGRLATGLNHFGPEAAELTFMYAVPEEFRVPRSGFPGGEPPTPGHRLSPDLLAQVKPAMVALNREQFNHEGLQGPLYYVAAGAWYNLGKAMGIGGANLLVWLRMMDVPVFIAMILMAYVFTRRFFPGSTYLQLGVPLLLMALPQDAYYSIRNDVPSALLVGATFFGLVGIIAPRQRGYAAYGLIGLGAAAAVLTKYTNAPILIVACAVAAWRLVAARRGRTLRQEVPRLLVLGVAIAVPLGAWAARNWVVLGDLTGRHLFEQHVGWTPKPLAQVLDHPFFHGGAFLLFLHDLAVTFWRGEITWGGKPLGNSTVDGLYVATTAIFCLVTMVSLIARRRERDAAWHVGVLTLAIVGLYIVQLAAISVSYDFGECLYPSREYPYFVSGRLLSGALIPFLAIYLVGLGEVIPKSLSSAWRWCALLAIVAVMLVSPLMLYAEVFASRNNWLHM